METKRSSALPMLAAIVLLLVVILGAYVGCYLLRSEVLHIGMYPSFRQRRYFATDWEAKKFKPAAKVESLVTGRHVSTHPPDTYPVLN
jgi:hypothetical protein